MKKIIGLLVLFVGHAYADANDHKRQYALQDEMRSHNYTMTREMCVKYAGDTWEMIRIQVAEFCQDQVTLLNLAQDSKEDVRQQVAFNEHIGYPIMSLLLRDPSVEVRYALLSNLKVPHSVVEALTHDPSSIVVQKALTKLDAYKSK